jgi:hypothetical protein
VRRGVRGVVAAAIVIGATAPARAQDCVTRPLLGHRVTAGADLSHSSAGETGFAASVTGRVVDRVRLSGAYQATRLDDVDHLAHQARLTLSAPASRYGFDLCPSGGLGYRRLRTEQANTHGLVSTRDAFVGASLGRSFSLSRTARVTPFVEPVFQRRSVIWESIDVWPVEGDAHRTEMQYWFGASLNTSYGAVIGRFRGGSETEFGLGFVRGLK